MLERAGSDIERLWVLNDTIHISIDDRLSSQNRLNMSSLKFRDVLCRIRLFPTLIPKMKWTYDELMKWALVLRTYEQWTYEMGFGFGDLLTI